MWRAEVDPRLRSNVMIVDTLDETPDWDRLLAAHEWATRTVPRLRERVVEPLWGLGAPTWAVDRELDLTFHVRRVRLPAPGTVRELLDLAQPLAMEPFDRARPLWEAVLVEGMEGGRAGYLLKLHHSLADGVGIVQVLSLLHSATREHSPNKPQYPPPPVNAPSPLGLLASQLARTAWDVPVTLVSWVPQLVARGAHALVHPVEAMSEAVGLVRSAVRVATPPQVPGSPLLAERGLSWRFEVLDVPLTDLKAAATATQASLNDVYLAGLLGGFRRYHEHFGEVPEWMPMGMPVSRRAPGDAPGGNRWAGTRVAAPLDEADPIERIRLIGSVVRSAVAEPAVDGLGLIAPVLSMLPAPLLAGIQGAATSSNDLQASNIPGIARPAYLAGAEIARSYPFAPLPGCAAMISLNSHHGVCCIGANLDAAAITEPDLFVRCLREGFDEVVALGSADRP